MAKQKARLEMNAQYSDFLKKQMNEKVVRKEYASQLKQLCTLFWHQNFVSNVKIMPKAA